VDHSLRELVAQPVFSIACGQPDANDSARWFGVPIHKPHLDRDPVEDCDLASQPTLSRFENRVGIKELYRLGEFLADSIIRRHGKRLNHRADGVTPDPTDDPAHGAQKLSFFTGHCDAAIPFGSSFSVSFPTRSASTCLYPAAPGPRDFARFDVGSLFLAELLCFFLLNLL
jgi:Transposase DDE domain group 1